jgi:hypothetical protein
MRLSGDKPKKMRAVWGDAVAMTTKADYMAEIKAGDPRTYVIYYDKINAYADKIFAPVVPTYTPPFINFNCVPQQLLDWVTTEFTKMDHPKSLVVWGPTRTGKTSWARSLVSTFFIIHCI